MIPDQDVRAALAAAGRALLAGDMDLYAFCRTVWEVSDPLADDPHQPVWLTELAERCERCDTQFDAATLDDVYAAARSMVRACQADDA